MPHDSLQNVINSSHTLQLPETKLSICRYMHLGRLLAVMLPGLFVQNYELSSSAKTDLISLSAQ